jgi:site-specific DNA-methyltransferase (adenine-specific)
MDRFLNQIIEGDCLEAMKKLPDKSIDMILCDLPYGTTACKWDTVIPFEPLWEQYKRLIKSNRAIVLTASQPFTTSLISSNMKHFKYCWVWNKKISGNPLLAKYQPLKIHEDVCVFSYGTNNYNPLMRKGKKRVKGGGYSKLLQMEMTKSVSDEYYPVSILEFSNAKRGLHPTQKPVALFEYLIKTYTQPGEIVLDNCIGSGTTAVAALNTGRFFIGIEKEPKYVEIARKRVEQAQAQQSLFA